MRLHIMHRLILLTILLAVAAAANATDKQEWYSKHHKQQLSFHDKQLLKHQQSLIRQQLLDLNRGNKGQCVITYRPHLSNV